MHALAGPTSRASGLRRFGVLRVFAAGIIAEVGFVIACALGCAVLIELTALVGG